VPKDCLVEDLPGILVPELVGKNRVVAEENKDFSDQYELARINRDLVFCIESYESISILFFLYQLEDLA
jgi:hypothetical protein